MPAIPVIALTGHLGAGKTTVLNHLLRTPHARIGVVVNDFGALNIDAALVSGQVDEPESVAGGCICCLPDDGGLDAALTRLARPQLRLDAIVLESSGLADPAAVARLVGFSTVDGVRPGGVVDVVDAVSHFDTVDRLAAPPARYGASSLVLVTKLDRVPAGRRDAVVERITARVRLLNDHAPVVVATGGRVDSALLFDVAGDAASAAGQLDLRELFAAGAAEPASHVHAEAVSVASDGVADPDRLLAVLTAPPRGVYRVKGVVALRHRGRDRWWTVHVVGGALDVAPLRTSPPARPMLVAIGTDVDTDTVRRRLVEALTPAGPSSGAAMMRWRRHGR